MDYVLGLAIASVTNPKGFLTQIPINFPGDDDQRAGVCLGILHRDLGFSEMLLLFMGGQSDHYLRTPIGVVPDQMIYRSCSVQAHAVDGYKSIMTSLIISKA